MELAFASPDQVLLAGLALVSFAAGGAVGFVLGWGASALRPRLRR